MWRYLLNENYIRVRETSWEYRVCNFHKHPSKKGFRKLFLPLPLLLCPDRSVLMGLPWRVSLLPKQTLSQLLSPATTNTVIIHVIYVDDLGIRPSIIRFWRKEYRTDRWRRPSHYNRIHHNMKVQIASRLFAGVFWLVQESSWSSSSRLRIQDDPNKKGSTSRTILQCVCSVLRLVLKSVGVIMAIIISFFALYYFAASPPLHLFYDVAPPAGPASVYLPVSCSREL